MKREISQDIVICRLYKYQHQQFDNFTKKKETRENVFQEKLSMIKLVIGV